MEALQFVQMSGLFYCPSELSEPWGLELPPMPDCLWFHAVDDGACTIDVDGERLQLEPGNVALIPHGAGHRLWGTETAPTPSVFDLAHDQVNDRYARLRHGGGGDATHLVCGGIRFDHPASRHLIEALPAVIHIATARSPRDDWLRSTLALMSEETRSPKAGSEAVISRLCDIMVIQAIRSWIDNDPAARTGWLGALRDDRIGAALTRIHADPAHPWTVAGLADEVAMSRSAFASRFTDLVGESAMRYVTRWRMFVALDLLCASDESVATIAQRVGYESEAAFSRAFKRIIGQSPGAARNDTRTTGARGGRSPTSG